jgi:hypothetical protein
LYGWSFNKISDNSVRDRFLSNGRGLLCFKVISLFDICLCFPATRSKSEIGSWNETSNGSTFDNLSINGTDLGKVGDERLLSGIGWEMGEPFHGLKQVLGG